MKLNFYKYQGTGNDFIICLDEDFNAESRGDSSLIANLCDRKFGIGADGFIVLEKMQAGEKSEFFMHYFNSDGKKSSLCGNGSRCAVAHANFLGWVNEKCVFEASDGLHTAVVVKNEVLIIKINMTNVYNIRNSGYDYVLDTGSPHYVKFVHNLDHIDIKESGRKIRNSEEFVLQGINVNFVKENPENIEVCTYERGVEDETLSCGTGVTAAAISHVYKNKLRGSHKIAVQTRGGELKVEFDRAEDLFCNIWLSGPAHLVFNGQIDTEQYA